jgi:dienelactone hydrolase
MSLATVTGSSGVPAMDSSILDRLHPVRRYLRLGYFQVKLVLVLVMGYCFGGAATLELARSGTSTN